MSLIAIPGDLTHALRLAPNLRASDRQELKSSSGRTPEEALARAVAVSERCWAGVDAGGEVVLIFGVSRLGEGLGSPWMVASDAVLQHGRQIARLTVPVIEAMHEDFPVLTNFADCRNALHLRWLRWAGFSFVRTTTEYAKDGAPFTEFIRIKNHVRRSF